MRMQHHVHQVLRVRAVVHDLHRVNEVEEKNVVNLTQRRSLIMSLVQPEHLILYLWRRGLHELVEGRIPFLRFDRRYEVEVRLPASEKQMKDAAGMEST